MSTISAIQTNIARKYLHKQCKLLDKLLSQIGQLLHILLLLQILLLHFLKIIE